MALLTISIVLVVVFTFIYRQFFNDQEPSLIKSNPSFAPILRIMSNKVKTVLVIGAGGNVGRPTIKHLLAKGFVVTGLTRDSSSTELSAGVTHLKTDYSLDSLKKAFQGQDAVVSTISGGGLGLQMTIIDAAIAAGVRVFFPSEYGADTSVPNASEIVPLLKVKLEVLEYLKTKEHQISWTALVIGELFDWVLDLVGSSWLDIPARTAILYDGGKGRHEATTTDQVGRAIASALEQPEAIKNRHVYINSFTTSQLEVVQALEQITGDKIIVSHESIENLRQRGNKRLQEGSRAGLLDLISSAFYGELGLCEFSGTRGLWNERLGLPQEDLVTVLKSYVGNGPSS
jgi:nucleoside-diphosphate-sugar epimerase